MKTNTQQGVQTPFERDREKKQKDRVLEGQSKPIATHYKPIENYGIIGDLHTAALIGIDGSIDWCCLPNFDSPSVFARILDVNKGGFFQICPGTAVQKQMYLPESCILMTRFLSNDGVSEVVDFMVPQDSRDEVRLHQIIRYVRGVKGKTHFKLQCLPAFDYARDKHTVRIQPEGAIFSSDHNCLGLTSPVPLKVEDGKAVCEFTANAGDSFLFVLRQCSSKENHPLLVPDFNYEKAFRETLQYWRN